MRREEGAAAAGEEREVAQVEETQLFHKKVRNLKENEKQR